MIEPKIKMVKLKPHASMMDEKESNKRAEVCKDN